MSSYNTSYNRYATPPRRVAVLQKAHFGCASRFDKHRPAARRRRRVRQKIQRGRVTPKLVSTQLVHPGRSGHGMPRKGPEGSGHALQLLKHSNICKDYELKRPSPKGAPWPLRGFKPFDGAGEASQGRQVCCCVWKRAACRHESLESDPSLGSRVQCVQHHGGVLASTSVGRGLRGTDDGLLLAA